MIENMSTLIDELKSSEIGKATRKSAQVIWKANLHAWNTTRDEFGRYVNAVVKQGEKLASGPRARTEQALESLSDAANERATAVEKRLQSGMNKVIHDIGLPTASEVDMLSRKVDRLSKQIQAKTAKRKVRRPRAKRAARTTNSQAA